MIDDPENDEQDWDDFSADSELEVCGESADEERSSAMIRGDLEFAQAREVVDNSTPVTHVLAEEKAKRERRFVRAAAHLEKAKAKGDQWLIDQAERAYQSAAEAWMECQDGGDDDGRPMTLSQALQWDRERSLDNEEQQHRLDALEVLLAYVWQEGLVDPWQGFKRFVAVTRRVKPAYLRGMTQTEVGLVLKETKAAPSAREKKVVEGLMRRFKMLGYHLLGDTKSDETRDRCRQAQMGNTNRRGGRRRSLKPA